MISLRYFILILLVGAQFTSNQAQENEENPDGPPKEDKGPDPPGEKEPAPPGEKEPAPPGEKEPAPPGEKEPPKDDEKSTKADETTTAATTTAATTTPATTTPATTTAPTKPTPPPKCKACYRNQNGMCRSFEVACTKIGKNLRDKNGLVWRMSPGGCANRKANEVKVCSSDCSRFKNANCQPARNPVCGYSANRRMCRLYPSICHLKKNSCNNPMIGDWRVARMARCNGLRVGARAVPC
ncbi:uncharacterized protein ACRADG_006670 [Cochliomyia hominivorax]